MRQYGQKIINWYAKYERPVSSIALVSGFIFASFTLKRVDLFIENFWVLVHLLTAAVGIVLINYHESKGFPEKVPGRIHFWLIILIQFGFGGLFSTFIVFYFRSATLSASWPFFILLIGAFAGNELLKHHYSRIAFQISIFFFAIYSFAIFFVPVLLHRIGDSIFILSGLTSLLFLGIFLWILWKVTSERFTESKKIILYCVGSIYFLINILYFTNIIPPIPLSLKDVGVYHNFIGDDNGNYRVMSETKKWYDNFRFFEVFHRYGGEPVYVYSAVFSPTNLNTNIFHQWKYFDEQRTRWVDSSKIEVPIVGGSETGYKMYSEKINVFPGLWRVDVLTTTNQVLGQIKFRIEDTGTPTKLVPEIK